MLDDSLILDEVNNGFIRWIMPTTKTHIPYKCKRVFIICVCSWCMCVTFHRVSNTDTFLVDSWELKWFASHFHTENHTQHIRKHFITNIYTKSIKFYDILINTKPFIEDTNNKKNTRENHTVIESLMRIGLDFLIFPILNFI